MRSYTFVTGPLFRQILLVLTLNVLYVGKIAK